MSLEEAFVAPPLDLFVAPLGEQAFRKTALLARELRRSGVSVELVNDAKLKRAMELANKMGACYALIVGDNEIAAGTYTLKNMATGSQETVTEEELKGRFLEEKSEARSQKPE